MLNNVLVNNVIYMVLERAVCVYLPSGNRLLKLFEMYTGILLFPVLIIHIGYWYRHTVNVWWCSCGSVC